MVRIVYGTKSLVPVQVIETGYTTKGNTDVLFGLSSRTTGVTLSFQSSMTHTDIMFSKVESD